MAKITPFLDTRRKLNNSMFPLCLRISHGKDTRLINLNIQLKKDEWNQKSFTIKKIEYSAKFNVELQNALLIAKKYISDNENNLRFHSINEIKSNIEFLITKKEENNIMPSVSILNYGKKIENLFLEAGKLKTAKWYSDCINSVIKFNNDKDILLIEIDVNFLERYKANCINKNHSKNTISARLRALRSIMNKARNEGNHILISSHNPFSATKIPSQKTRKRAVSKEEIDKLRNLEFIPFSRSWHCRNYFLFMFNMQGMNFVDLAKLKVSQIKGDRIIYTRSKTNRYYDIKVTHEASKIITQYNINKKAIDYLFPILKQGVIDPILITKQCSNGIYMFNKLMREISKKYEFSQPLTSYVARHSWANAARKLGFATDKIGDALGHDNYKTTEIYLKEFDRDEIDAINQLVTY